MPDFEFVEMENGVGRYERYEGLDRTGNKTGVEWRADDGWRLRFEAFDRRDWLISRKIGAKIQTRSSTFEYAAIHSIYFADPDGGGQFTATREDSDHDDHDSDLEEYERRGPYRVESLCAAQWRGANFEAIVSKGDPVRGVLLDGMPIHPPLGSDWPPPGGITVAPTQLHLAAPSLGRPGRGSVTLQNKEGTPQTLVVSEVTPRNQGFVVDRGERELPVGGTTRVAVTYVARDYERAEGTFTISTPAGRRWTISLSGSAKRLGDGQQEP